MLVIDPLSGAFGNSENDRTAVYDFVSSFRGWADKAQCAVLAIGHLPKSEEGKRAGFSGSTAWEASARSMWLLSKESFSEEKVERNYWALLHTKANYAPIQSTIPLIKHNLGWWQQANSPDDAADSLDAYQTSTANSQEDTRYDAEEIKEADIPEF